MTWRDFKTLVVTWKADMQPEEWRRKTAAIVAMHGLIEHNDPDRKSLTHPLIGRFTVPTLNDFGEIATEQDICLALMQWLVTHRIDPDDPGNLPRRW